MMSERNEDTTPEAPPTQQGEIPPDRAPDSALEGYHTAADTVGLIPSLRWKDNLFQAVFIVVVTGVCALIGLLANPLGGVPGQGPSARMSALLLGIGGLIGSFFLSGLFLMVLGWIRASKKIKS